MNTKLYLKTLLFALLTVTFFGCSKEEDSEPVVKDVTYEVVMEKSSSGSPFYIQGSYVDEKGETKKLDQETPWKLTLKNVPVGVKSVFRGKLYCISTEVIKGYILMQATDPRNGKVLYRNKKEMDASKYVSGSLGYTGAEMDKETSFEFVY